VGHIGKSGGDWPHAAPEDVPDLEPAQTETRRRREEGGGRREKGGGRREEGEREKGEGRREPARGPFLHLLDERKLAVFACGSAAGPEETIFERIYNFAS